MELWKIDQDMRDMLARCSRAEQKKELRYFDPIRWMVIRCTIVVESGI